jgi:UDP-glucose 4-epimerase
MVKKPIYENRLIIMKNQDQSQIRLTTLIVGGGGFIGSHLAHHLARQGEREVIITGRSAVPRFPLPNSVSYIQGDAGDVAFISKLLEKCDEVIDLAYATVPKTSFDDPVHDVLVNLPSSVVLLRQASQRKLRRFMLVSSGGTVYGNADYLPIDERHPTNPASPYGITKLALEKYALMFQRLEGLPVVIVRPGNPYGPNQFGKLAQGFVGAAMYAAMKGDHITVFGEQGTIRDYIHVDDLCRGIIAAMNKGLPGDVFNIGSGVGYNNLELLDVLKTIVEPDGFQVRIETRPARPFDVATNVLSTARLTFASGWQATIDLEAGLRQTWDWVRSRGKYE